VNIVFVFTAIPEFLMNGENHAEKTNVRIVGRSCLRKVRTIISYI
jgi:hypothetical protein